MQWEQRLISSGTNNPSALDAALQQVGAEGWEVAGVSGVDRTLGTNGIVCVVRRQIVPPAAPESDQPGWHPDPCGRWEVRYWTGAMWSAHVANKDPKKQGVDSPQTLPETPWPV